MTNFYWWSIEWSRKSGIEDLDSLIRPIQKKKKKTLEGPNLTPSPGRVQAAIMSPNKQSNLKFLTKKMAQIFIILYLIPEPQNLSSWDLREAESRESERGWDENRPNSGDWRLERGGEQRLERKVKFLGFWVDLFVLICG